MAIIQLDSHLVDQIAAGEVVEKPAQLVKELVENSLDAGATEVRVEIHGELELIKVIDNGQGMDAADLALALHRHTTSKLRAVEDLWQLSSYGFRGEALASIAAVSEMVVRSRQAGSELGAEVCAHNGRLTEPARVSCPHGTSVQVAQLFNNVPARKKFLKTASHEISTIRGLLKAMALANHKVSFHFLLRDSLDFHFAKAPTRLARAEQVLGVKPLYFTRGDFADIGSVEIAFASPSQVAKSARQMHVFVQGRVVNDRGLVVALTEAYRSLLMHGEYPVVALWMDLNPEWVDVNVHPTKSQVKFQDAGVAFRMVSRTLRAALEQAPWAPQKTTTPASTSAPGAMPVQAPLFEERRTQFAQKYQLPERQEEQVRWTLQDLQVIADRRELRTQGEASEIANQPTIDSPRTEHNNELTIGFFGSLQVLSQAHLTYIVCQSEKALVLIDQHAAHERVLYERVRAQWQGHKVEIQEFLFPLVLDLEQHQKDFLIANSLEFMKLGIRLDELGPQSVGIASAPTYMKESKLPEILKQWLEQAMLHGGSEKLDSWVTDLAATVACHSAIRAGQALSLSEMSALLRQMDEFPLSGYCPHGRPVMIEFTSQFLEKEFGRIAP